LRGFTHLSGYGKNGAMIKYVTGHFDAKKTHCILPEPEKRNDMKVLILSMGTRGDIEPYIGLAQAFKSTGIMATLASTVN